MRRWLYEIFAPVSAFASFFIGFYALLISTSRADWWLTAPLATATIGGAVGAFIFRKTRPDLALALSTLPAVLTIAAIALR